MAKTAPTITIPSSPTEMVLEIVYQDFRGQKGTQKIMLDGATIDNDIKSIVSDLDMLSNAQIVSAKLLTVTVLGGLTNTAQNALERNLSEEFQLNFEAVDTVNVGKTVNKSIRIPAMAANMELIDGSIDITNSWAADLLGTSTNNYNDGSLTKNLYYKLGDNSSHSGMHFIISTSNHITTDDKVDTV